MAGPTPSNILTIIFNKSITEGIFPTALKVAKVIPIHKSESIFTRLNDFIRKLNIIYRNQFGFQKNKSTELAVESIISNIVKSFEDKDNAY